MKTMKYAFSLIIILILALTALTSCRGGEVEQISIVGTSDIELSFGESITLEAEVSPSDAKDKTISWSVIDTNLGEEYTLDGSTFTAGNLAGYAVIRASSSNGKTADATIVINPEFDEEEPSGFKATFYAVDGTTVIDVRYADGDGRVSAPSYAVSNGSISWVDASGAAVDFDSIVLFGDCSFYAVANKETVYYSISYWYYDELGEAIQQGGTYRIAADSGESVPESDVLAIEQAIEAATGRSVINWKVDISGDGLTIKWYAELK